MKKRRKISTVALAFLLCASSWMPVIASNNSDASYTCSLSQNTIYVSDQEQLITMTVRMNEPVAAYSVSLKVDIPETFMIDEMERDSRLDKGKENLSTGVVKGTTADKENFDLEVPVVVTYIIPENTPAGSYTVGVSDVKIYEAVYDEEGEFTKEKLKTSGSASATFTISEKQESFVSVTDISLDKNTLNIGKGASESLTAAIAPENASDKSVGWMSTNENVAVVDANGVVTGKEKGTATIIAETGDGAKKASCEVTVNALDYTIQFETDGGSTLENVNAQEGSVIDLSPYVSEKEGYNFAGWYQDETLTREVKNLILKDNTTLYAKWITTASTDPSEMEKSDSEASDGNSPVVLIVCLLLIALAVFLLIFFKLVRNRKK